MLAGISPRRWPVPEKIFLPTPVLGHDRQRAAPISHEQDFVIMQA